jgi:hypothetical protein
VTLFWILIGVFGSVALMVVLGERYARPPSPQQMRALQRWLLPLIGAALVLSVVRHYWL